MDFGVSDVRYAPGSGHWANIDQKGRYQVQSGRSGEAKSTVSVRSAADHHKKITFGDLIIAMLGPYSVGS